VPSLLPPIGERLPRGAFGAQGCSVVPDPSTGTGSLTPRMAALYTQVVTGGWHPSCCRPSDPVAHSDHSLGKACDAPPGSYGTLPTAAQKAAGDALAASFAGHRRSDRCALPDLVRPDLESRPHPRGLAALPWGRRLQHHPAPPDGVTGGHYDHVHTSVY